MTSPALAQNVRGKGRHYQNPVTGDLVPSVTNVIGILDKPALPRWAAKMVAERAALMKRSLGPMDDADIVDMLKAVPWQRSSRAADRGTDIHDYLEHGLKRIEPPRLSPDAEPYRAAADRWLDECWGHAEDVETELTVFHPQYAGTLDFVARSGDGWAIGDFKTSKAIYPEAALQLSALMQCYTQADGSPVPWRDADGELLGPVELVVVRIGMDGFEERSVADSAACVRAFFGLLDAWHWRHSEVYL